MFEDPVRCYVDALFTGLIDELYFCSVVATVGIGGSEPRKSGLSMIEFAGHRLSEESISANWPPSDKRVSEAFSSLSRLIALNMPLLESIKAASDSVTGCPATIYALKQLFDGLQRGGTISGTLGSVECCRKLAFAWSDRRIHLISIGEECGTVDMALRMAAEFPKCIEDVKESVAQQMGARIDDEQAFLILALGLYFSAGIKPVAILEKLLPLFSPQSDTKRSLVGAIDLLKQGRSVFECLTESQLLPRAIAEELLGAEDQSEVEMVLLQLANLAPMPVQESPPRR